MDMNNQPNAPVLDRTKIPAHVAIIMDGNGRWAKARHLPRVAGHQQGMQTVKKVTMAASELGIKVLTLYAFSTENWKRPATEVKFLMQLPIRFFNTFVPDLVKQNVRVMVMGDVTALPPTTREAVERALDATKDCTGMILNFALNYGGRDELVRAVQLLAGRAAAGELDPTSLTEAQVSRTLMTAPLGDLADPDVIIRTSGEERLSNFMLWQAAYSELVFMDQQWPEFDATALAAALAIYQGRHRRYGGLTNK